MKRNHGKNSRAPKKQKLIESLPLDWWAGLIDLNQ